MGGTLTSPVTYTASAGSNTFLSGTLSLQANTSYWAVLRAAAGQFFWSATSNVSGDGVGFLVQSTGSSDGGNTWDGPYSDQPLRMQVNASSQAEAVPEPSTLFLFGGVLMGAFAYRRRRMMPSRLRAA